MLLKTQFFSPLCPNFVKEGGGQKFSIFFLWRPLVNQQSGPSEMCLIEGLGLFNFVKEELKDESFHVRFLVTI